MIGLGRADDRAADAHRMNGHGGRGHDHGLLRAHRQRNADGMPAAQYQRHRGLFHPGNQLRNGKSCFNIAAHGIEQNQEAVDLRALLNGRDLGDHVLIFRGFRGFRQNLMALDLPDDGQAVDVPRLAFQFCAAKFNGLLPLLLHEIRFFV